MEINAEELNKALHKVPTLVKILQEAEKECADIREILIKAIDHRDQRGGRHAENN